MFNVSRLVYVINSTCMQDLNLGIAGVNGTLTYGTVMGIQNKTAISADTMPNPTPVITANGHIFHRANVLCRTCIPFWFNICFHSNPARLALKVNDTAPILDETAKAIAADRLNASRFTSVSTGADSVACRTTLVSRIVAPMFVPLQLQRITPRTPTSQTVGCILRPDATTSQ